MWIHEGWTTYLESLYVEYNYGYDDAMKYLNAYKKKVKNDRPIITARGTNTEPSQDQYFKGALFINTLRGNVNDDAKWWPMLRGYYQKYKYKNIMTEDIEQYFNQKMGMDLTPVFDQYLRHTAIPKLELNFDEAAGTVQYRWVADEKAFAMPVRVGTKEHWETIHPTTDWQTMKTPLTKDQFEVATDLYYIDVSKT
jgi:aminopeptidase N